MPQSEQRGIPRRHFQTWTVFVQLFTEGLRRLHVENVQRCTRNCVVVGTCLISDGMRSISGSRFGTDARPLVACYCGVRVAKHHGGHPPGRERDVSIRGGAPRARSCRRGSSDAGGGTRVHQLSSGGRRLRPDPSAPSRLILATGSVTSFVADGNRAGEQSCGGNWSGARPYGGGGPGTAP